MRCLINPTNPIRDRTTLLSQLAQMSRIFSEGVSDLSDNDLESPFAPANTPNEALDLAESALARAVSLFNPWIALAQRPDSSLSPKERFGQSAKGLLAILTECEQHDLDRKFVEPIEIAGFSDVKTPGQAISCVLGYLSILAGDISVARTALGRPEQDWQRVWIF
jgi:hypothetical protein